MNCPRCQAANPNDASFCGSCGESFAAAVTGGGWICGSCATSNPTEAQFCGACGQASSATTATAHSTDATPAAVAMGGTVAGDHVEAQRGRRRWPLIAAAAVGIGAIALGAVFVLTQDSDSSQSLMSGETEGSDDDADVTATVTTTPPEQAAVTTISNPATTAGPTSTSTTTSTTSTSTTTSTTSTTTTTTTTLPPDPEVQASGELDALLTADEQRVEEIVDTWVPQLSAKRLGLEWEGVTYGYAEILADHAARRAAWDAVLVDGATYNFTSGGEQMVGWYITLVPRTHSTADRALAWCVDNDFGRDDCIAKLVTDRDDVGVTTKLLP